MASQIALKGEVLSAYRCLLRSRNAAFKGDNMMLNLSLQQIRAEFKKNANIRDSQEISQLASQAKEAAEFLRTSIVQASKTAEQEKFDIHFDGAHVTELLDQTCIISPIDEKAIRREEVEAMRQARGEAPSISNCCNPSREDGVPCCMGNAQAEAAVSSGGCCGGSSKCE